MAVYQRIQIRSSKRRHRRGYEDIDNVTYQYQCDKTYKSIEQSAQQSVDAADGGGFYFLIDCQRDNGKYCEEYDGNDYRAYARKHSRRNFLGFMLYLPSHSIDKFITTIL